MSGTFFLGLGGQKCGSSWIQAYLAARPGSDFGRLGEYQAWEHRLGGVFARYAVDRPSLAERLRARTKMAVGASEPAAHLRWRLQSDPEEYFDYFAGLLARRGILRTGDVTPSYAALPAGDLITIRQGLEARGMTVRAIYAMRDPVERLWSQLRMDIERGRADEAQYPAEALLAFSKTPEAQARSDYDRTLATLEEVFAKDERHICLFEEVFTPEGIANLSRFAGVDADPGAGERVVNERPGRRSFSDEVTREVARALAPVYEAAAARLPQITTLWPSARFVL